ncbi:MAG: hypothetical protein H3Z50_05005 [archaeon]|nr:hypothetical protein [archaeon]MCP8305615.1 hypothetical protein [archaeon]
MVSKFKLVIFGGGSTGFAAATRADSLFYSVFPAEVSNLLVAIIITLSFGTV